MTGNPDLKQKQLMRRAELVLQEHGLLTLPVDLDALAQAAGIHLREMDRKAEGVSGMLLRYGDQFGVMYATHIDNEGFERFSIGHEFGHYFVEGHLDHIPFDGGVHRSRAGFISDDPYEREADYFSAGLLMPSSLIRPVLRRAQEGLPSVEAIRRAAKASLTASAIRYINETDDAAAIVVSRQGQVDYCFKSESLKQLKGQSWLRKGAALPAGTLTASMAARPAIERRGRRDETETDILDWFGGDRAVRAVEQVVDLGRYDRVLTVLSCAQLVDDTYRDEDDFDESDEAMEARWTPRFR
ncbi:ImmA/IrrE family metallo-endopeptidase [Jiella pelagia]|uniref:ImmA/IrrE family metallo-endopeptidase n=1 Tax=Jiella pelagia TaxID=2986949 RepID=A0ABY7BTU1_9HYPH|nr:ImmA/IrrE family metallo-endopeptidase [Jiella pelagia]WAP66819.1 ImmA/IrrE family metallo-endopeptidase [Jiella pelagia]